MTNVNFVQYFADGYTVAKIADKENISKRTLEKRVDKLKRDNNCKSIPELVALYCYKRLIKYKPLKKRNAKQAN